MDRRITVYADPALPGHDTRSFADDGIPMKRVVWWDKGVLADLPYNRSYAVKHGLNGGYPLHGAISGSLPIPFHMTGGEATVEEMIRQTRSGFLITRLNGVFPTDFKSLTCTGNTRDGLWYVEGGKIIKSVKNFRIQESPFFILNAVDIIGRPQRIYSPRGSTLIPPVKVRDFSFTSIADAI
jgi:predicted Zn-dependent protease